MKDGDHTPQKEDIIANRRSKASRLKKPQKIVKKSLDAVFAAPVSEDVSSFDTAQESIDFSPISEISDANSTNQIAQTLNELTPITKIASNKDELDIASMEFCDFHQIHSSVEVDIVSNFLKQARKQVLNSNDVNHTSKKLVDALVMVVLDECYSLPEETDCYSELVSSKFRVVFLCFLIWSFIVSSMFFGFRLDSCCDGFSPT